jgi:hypothetical protein
MNSGLNTRTYGRVRQRFLEWGGGFLDRSSRQHHRHPLRDRERLGRRSRRRAGAKARQGWRDVRRTPRVVKTAYDELAFESRGERLVGITELSQGPFDDIDRLHPTKQRRVGLGDIERDLGPLPRVGRQPQRLLQSHASLHLPGARLRPSSLAQDVNALAERGRFQERPIQQLGRGAGRAALHRRVRSLPQACQDPIVAARPDAHEVRRYLSGRSSVSVQDTGGGPVESIALVACQRRLYPVADDWVDELRRVVGREHLRANEGSSQPDGVRHSDPGGGRRDAELAAVTSAAR